ncbi:cytochrome c oxidase subunit 3 [Luteithermobacter gelatinilyticus]|uniref:cytochrome c oxidase subunit 3 n=1 Tax=Luteithermobacter gelatinilyticus TaxID=2582913 RepID=UPI001105F2D5|nr:cytochrome c oxidase subunit 3 [Luteithermobacter gelatinilyticus]|tara:strand:- start:5895 stop:6710 length:816 start_codon:yes stop_codon:yes gene_type:complete
MSDSHATEHEYHLVDPSPWPLICSIGAFVTGIGLVLLMHFDVSWVVITGAVILAYGAYSWWGDVIDEGEHKGFHKPIVQLGLRYGMFLFIISEVMFFVAWFWAYFNASLFPTEAVGGVWPPEGVETLDPWHLPLVNTLILLTSGCTVTWAHHALVEGDRSTFLRMLTFTILLGLSFTGIQAYEYAHASFGFEDGIYSSTFYMATGFHGAHVIIGTIFLLVCLLRGLRGHFKPDHHFGFEAAAWYWHFVDVVWLVLFFSIYVAGSSNGVAGH